MVATPAGTVRAKLYVPTDVESAPGVVIAHGVHHLGISEPRLVNFSRSIAATGVVVLTPELAPIADYHVDRSSVDVIGWSARRLAEQLKVRQVGVMGLSFSGGLALLAAAEPRFADSMSFVVCMGGHDDLERVLRFFATGQAPRPDGSVERLKAHEYGVLVAVYSQIEDFFSPADVPQAREALRLLLWEDIKAAEAQAARLSPQGQERMRLLFTHQTGAFTPEILQQLPKHAASMAEVSPHGHLAGLRVPVLVLHGAGDDVIPATEALWLEREIPPQYLRSALVSTAVSHVEVNSGPGLRDRLALLHWIADVLAEMEAAPRGQNGRTS